MPKKGKDNDIDHHGGKTDGLQGKSNKQSAHVKSDGRHVSRPHGNENQNERHYKIPHSKETSLSDSHRPGTDRNHGSRSRRDVNEKHRDGHVVSMNSSCDRKREQNIEKKRTDRNEDVAKVSRRLPCETKTQYLLTLQVSRYCPFTLYLKR